MVVLLQDVLGLVDEDCGALQALPAVGNLLGQLPQLHHLPGERETPVLRSLRGTEGTPSWPGDDHGEQGAVKGHSNAPMALGRK